jgi:pyruvate carboxylase
VVWQPDYTSRARLRQALSLGLGEQWVKVKEAYAQANLALGDLVKVGSGS